MSHACVPVWCFQVPTNLQRILFVNKLKFYFKFEKEKLTNVKEIKKERRSSSLLKKKRKREEAKLKL